MDRRREEIAAQISFNSLFEMRTIFTIIGIIYIVSFNSLFEMPRKSSMCCRTMRTTYGFNSLFEMPTAGSSAFLSLRREGFNSLFEMPAHPPEIAFSKPERFNSLFEMQEEQRREEERERRQRFNSLFEMSGIS